MLVDAGSPGVGEDGGVGDAVERPLARHERHDGGLDAPAEADDGQRRVRHQRLLAAVVRRRVRAGRRRVVLGQLGQDGEEAAEPRLGVGRGSDVDADHPYLRAVSRGPLACFPSRVVFHIAWSGDWPPARTDRDNADGAVCWF